MGSRNAKITKQIDDVMINELSNTIDHKQESMDVMED